MKKEKSKIILVTVITIIIFIIIFSKIDFHSVIDVLSHANIWFLFLALLITIPLVIIGTLKWQIILQSMGYNIPFKECLYIIMGSNAISSITPSKSGDVIRAYFLKNKIPISKTVGSVLTERIFDVFSLAIFSLIGLIIYSTFEALIFIIIVLICIFGVLFIPHLQSRIQIKKSWDDKLENLFVSLKIITEDRKIVLVLLCASFSFWFLSIVQTSLFFSAIGIDIPLLFIMANLPIAIFIGMVPLTLGGMGTRDSAFIVLFSNYAKPKELLAVGILFSFFRYWLLSLIGIPFMRKMLKE